MDLFETLEPEPALHFAAVQITRTVTASSLRSSTTFAHESPINQKTPNTTKVAKLVFAAPKPVQTKAKIAIKNNQEKQQRESSSVAVLLAPPTPQVAQNEIADKRNRDQSPVRRREDIELERAKAAVRREKEKKTLNATQSPAINKSKMDDAARSEARKFMRKQREKRKMEVKREVDNTIVIKQRLEELRVSTKSAIVKQTKRKSPLKVSPPKDSNYYSLDNNRMKEVKVLKLKPMTGKLEVTNELNVTIEKVIVEPELTTPVAPQNQQQPKRQPPMITVEDTKENTKPLHEDFQLKVPDVKLSPHRTIKRSEQPTIPFWLQNTKVQPYPYNFIWAVRKKLEAFTSQCETQKQTRFDLDTPQVKRDRKGRKLPQVSDEEESETNAKSMEHDMPSEANTISEISSIRSDLAKSLSHEKQDANASFKSLTDDPFVGKKRESVNSAFDRTSFDKRCESLGPDDVSANTSEKRNNFLSSTRHAAAEEDHAEVIFKKPADMPQAGGINDLDNNNKLSEEKEEEFRKMLLAFNKSLSHVVEVNHLLSNALVSKSPSVASASSTRREYSSSFEKNVESSNISEMIENLVNQRPVTVAESHKSDTGSSIRTLIGESNTVEDPPIAYEEPPQELTSSTTKVTTTTTRTEIIHQQQQQQSVKEEHEATFNESKLINMFRLSESESDGASNTSALDHLNKSTSEIKSWERSLMERTRGQIAWLELQKINFKKHGNWERVTAVKKQQRAILLRLEKERMQLRESRKSEKALVGAGADDDLLEKAMMKLDASVDFTGNDTETRDNIERILQQREQKIVNRRRKIEHLLSWQRRLDDEERKLKLMEQELLNANKIKLIRSPNKKSSDNDILNTSFEMVKSINKSLKMLENVEITHDDETVDVAGYKMNKLWHRLTGEADEKFRPQEVYRLTKRELAQFYEDAKETVLESDLKIFLETSQPHAHKPESESESDNEQVPEPEEVKESTNDTMESIANIETEEEEFAGSYEPEPEENPEETATEDDEELQQLLANQMRVFVDQKPPAAVSDETFQVQRKSQGEARQHDTNSDDESSSPMELVAAEEQSPINTEPIESIDLSAVDDDGSIIPEQNSLQVTDMDDDDGQLIEDISFPNLEISLADSTAANEYEESRAHDLSTITECTEYEQVSSEPISSEIVTHTSSTPTTSERLNSEIEQRLLSLSDSLEQVDEAFKRLPMMMSVPNSATYSTDQDFIDSKMLQEFENEHVLSGDEHGIALTSTPKTLP